MTDSTQSQPRHPKDSPDGGKFAPKPNGESRLELDRGPVQPFLPCAADLEAESDAVWSRVRQAQERAEVHTLALMAARIRESSADASEIVLLLGYDANDSDDAETYVCGVELFSADGQIVAGDGTA